MASARSRCAFSGPGLVSSCFSSRSSAFKASESMSKSAYSSSLSPTEQSPVLGYACWNAKTPIVVSEDGHWKREEGREEKDARCERKPRAGERGRG